MSYRGIPQWNPLQANFSSGNQLMNGASDSLQRAGSIFGSMADRDRQERQFTHQQIQDGINNELEREKFDEAKKINESNISVNNSTIDYNEAREKELEQRTKQTGIEFNDRQNLQRGLGVLSLLYADNLINPYDMTATKDLMMGALQAEGMSYEDASKVYPSLEKRVGEYYTLEHEVGAKNALDYYNKHYTNGEDWVAENFGAEGGIEYSDADMSFVYKVADAIFANGAVSKDLAKNLAASIKAGGQDGFKELMNKGTNLVGIDINTMKGLSKTSLELLDTIEAIQKSGMTQKQYIDSLNKRNIESQSGEDVIETETPELTSAEKAAISVEYAKRDEKLNNVLRSIEASSNQSKRQKPETPNAFRNIIPNGGD